MELNKLCRTCLSAAEDMTSLYEMCATSSPICCAEILSIFTPILYCKDDGLPTMICRNCIREVNRCRRFRLKCLASDGVLRKHVPRVTGVAATNMTVTNDMDEDSCNFEEVPIKNESPTSSKKEQSAKSLIDPLTITEMQEDMNQTLDIVKHEIDFRIKIENDDDISIEINNAPANERESEKTYSCTICSKSYTYSRNLKFHMMSHTGKKHYPCTVCDSTYKSGKQLKNHMRVHTGDKPYTCSICSNSFKHSAQLAAHMLTHIGEKPYTCSICNNSYKHLPNLKIHMRTHTGEKPYACTVCGSSFTQMAHLKSHMRTHVGEQPNPCTVCDCSFKTKRLLTIHQRQHTGEK